MGVMKPTLLAFNSPRTRRSRIASPRPQSISLRIQALRLNGFSGANTAAIRDSLQRKLAASLSHTASRGAWFGDANASSPQTTHTLPPNATADQVVQQVGQAIRASIGIASPTSSDRNGRER